MSYAATPRCFVEIYPFEGGPYVIQGDAAGVLAVTVIKNIRSAEPGTFAIQMAPGGPNGLNANPQWLDIITPMSTILIGLRRAGDEQCVMVGVITSITEQQSWTPGEGSTRSISITGFDFQFFFSQANYYTLALLNSSFLSAVNPATGLSFQDSGLLQGTPDKVALAWYNRIMVGPNSIMAKTVLPIQTKRLPIYDLMKVMFEPYDYLEPIIPAAENFMTSGGDWMSKFLNLFPFPWYEFFVITAPKDTYGTIKNQPAGTELRMLSMPNAPPVIPTVVGRVNPLPWTENAGGTATKPNLKMNTVKWIKLPGLNFGTTSIQQTATFSDAEVRNYYAIIPTFFSTSLGFANNQQSPFNYLFSNWVDIGSIHRYGYRPQVRETNWFTDPTGAAAQRLAAQNKGFEAIQLLVSALALRQTSYFEPTPLMARSSVMLNLTPSALPGTRVRFYPFKDDVLWEFYVEGVSHSYTFGKGAVTSLSLSRGLPQWLYQDDKTLLDVHTGNATRVNGTYASGNVAGIGGGLQPLNTFTIQKNLLAEIAQVFATPGAS